MNIYLKIKMKKAKKTLINGWYNTMSPLANYLNERDKRKYKEDVEKMTLELAVKYMKKDIIDHMIRRNTTMYLVVADWMSTEDLPYNTCLGSYNRIFKNDKARMGYSKYKWTIENQLLIVEALRETKGVTVEEEIEKFTWQKVDNYRK